MGMKIDLSVAFTDRNPKKFNTLSYKAHLKL